MTESGTYTTVDYRWRKAKVAYIVATLVIVILTMIAINLYNSRHMCGVRWQGTYGYDECTTAKNLGHGVSTGYAFLVLVILALGYFFVLPRVYRYVTPVRTTDEIE